MSKKEEFEEKYSKALIEKNIEYADGEASIEDIREFVDYFVMEILDELDCQKIKHAYLALPCLND